MRIELYALLIVGVVFAAIFHGLWWAAVKGIKKSSEVPGVRKIQGWNRRSKL